MAAVEYRGRLLEVFDAYTEVCAYSAALTHATDTPAAPPPVISDGCGPELGFLRLVCWLHALYHSHRPADTAFLVSCFATYGLDDTKAHEQHYQLIPRQRRLLLAQFEPAEREGDALDHDCVAWFQSSCGTRKPSEKRDWQLCIKALLGRALAFLAALKRCLVALEQDEHYALQRDQWLLRRQHLLPAQFYDTLIAQTASDLGREAWPLAALRARYHKQWNDELSLLTAPYNANDEARRRVEKALLGESLPILPLSSADLLREFNIGPGKQLETLLWKALQLYLAFTERPTPEQLLARLRQELAPAAAPAAVHTHTLSPREHEVLLLLAQEQTNLQIAEQLRVSQATVKNHLNSIYSKLGTRTRAGAVLWASNAGLLAEPPDLTA